MQAQTILMLFPLFLYTLLSFPTITPLYPVAEQIAAFYTVGNLTFRDDYLWMKNIAESREYINQENRFFVGFLTLQITVKIATFTYISVSNTALRASVLTSRFTDKTVKKHASLTATLLKQLQKDSILNEEFSPCFLNDIKNLDNLWVHDKFMYLMSGNLYYRTEYQKNDCKCLQRKGKAELVLDVTPLLGDGYSMVGSFEVIDELVAVGIDTIGNEKYDLYVINITTANIIYGPIKDTYYSVRWMTQNSQSWLYYNLVSTQWGVPLSIGRAGPFGISKKVTDTVVYTENDPAFNTELYHTNDRKHLFIKISGMVTSDIKLITTNDDDSLTLKSLRLRAENIIYDVEHNTGYWYIRTNQFSVDYDIIKVPASQSLDYTISSKLNLPSSRPSDFIEKLEMFSSHILLWIRRDGNRRVVVHTLSVSGKDKLLPQNSSVYTIAHDLGQDLDSRIYRTFETACVIFANSSFLQPPALFSLDLKTATPFGLFSKTSIKALEEYEEDRIFANTADSAQQIPISIVYRKDQILPAPLIILSYGAYGGYIDPTFTSELFTMLDRGYTWVICHPRGDGDMGSSWYTSGKYNLKQHTFDDTNSCIDHLITSGRTQEGMIALKGRSAGGLVAGNAIVSSDSKVDVVIAHVPFVDPIYDGMDDSIPWTAYEWFEWGNPKQNLVILEAMIQYSPYLAISSATLAKPKAVYVSCGINDPRVPFYEPLKFVAKLRQNLGSSKYFQIVIRVDDQGHFTAHGDKATAEWMAYTIANIN